MLKLKCN